MTPDVETWKPVLGYEGLYEVSDQGNIRSVDRYVGNRWGGEHLRRGAPMRIQINRRGYPMVGLRRDGSQRFLYVHRLVAEAFLEPRPEGMHVLHWNDVKTDNTPDNLRYGTVSENQLDRVRNGIHEMANRTHCKNGHEFTPENTGVLHRKRGRRCRKCAAETTRRRRVQSAKERRSA